MAALAEQHHTRGRRKGGQTLSEQIYRALRSDIITCRLKPGAMIFEGDVARQYRVSRAPVREAIKRLAQEGLVESEPSLGHRVKPVTLQDVRELFKMRQILEVAAITEAVHLASEEQLEQLASLAGESFALADEAARIRWHQQNVEFHVALAALSQNSRLEQAVRSTIESMYRLEHVNLSFRASTDSMVQEHLGIVEALRQRDAGLAAERALAALEVSLRLIQNSLAGGGSRFVER